MPHPANWYAGWTLILIGMIGGAGLGLFFARPDFLGGYTAWPRRLVRLGHIALVALGILNILLGLSPLPAASTWQADFASAAMIGGAVTMPLVCFLSAWKPRLKGLFFIPVAALLAAVTMILTA